MNTFIQAADEVRKLSRMFKALDVLVDVLDKVGSLEQAENESKIRLATVAAETESLKADVNAARELADGLVEKAKGEATKVLSDAHLEASEETAAAKALMAEATEKAAAADSDAQTRLRTAEGVLDALVQKTTDKEVQLADIETRIADGKAYLAKMAGL